MAHHVAVLVAMALVLGGCQKTKAVKEDRGKEAEMKTLQVTSAAFQPGKPIPTLHAYKGEGENTSPPLSWSGAPAGTKTFALIVDDPDAPSPKNPRPEPWVHWVLFNIPAEKTSLAAGESAGTPGQNDFKERSWGGPMPPPGSGTHRYFFKVYALDAKLGLPVGTTKPEVVAAMKGHILAQGELFGTYERN